MHKLINQRFGRLIVKAVFRKKVISKDNVAYWVSFCDCICDCGNTKTVRESNLLVGRHRSCNCLQTERRTKHGKSRTPIYVIWRHIIDRCTNKNSAGYKYYGGRGIRVCRDWHRSFQTFYLYISEHIGTRPSLKHSIDRINNNGNYEPGNIRWATKLDQSNNTRRNVFITINKQSMTISQAERLYNKPRNWLRRQIKRQGFFTENLLK